jgi:hypothetical protein
MLTLTMRLLIDRPEVYRRCCEDLAYARAVDEESFRYHSTTSNQRILNEDLVYRDVLLEKDAIVWFPLSVATHDPRYAEEADTFDPERKQENPHIGFGLGPHICLGQYIARADPRRAAPDRRSLAQSADQRSGRLSAVPRHLGAARLAGRVRPGWRLIPNQAVATCRGTCMAFALWRGHDRCRRAG